MQRHPLFWITIGLGLAACAGAPVTPEQRRQAEARLLAPFRQAAEIGCSELQITMTGNFYPNVARPAVDGRLHRQEVTTRDGYTETTWTNLAGGLDGAFDVTIGEPPEITERGLVHAPRLAFKVLNQLRVRVLTGVHELTLDAVAGGGIVVVKTADGRTRDLRELRIAEGAVQER